MNKIEQTYWGIFWRLFRDMTAYFALFYISFIVKIIAQKLENNMFKLEYHIYIYDFI